MKKVWFIAFVLICGIATALLSCDREPQYARQSYTYWFKQFYTSSPYGTHDTADRDEAVFALRKMGTNVYPLLIEECFSKEKGTKFGKVFHDLTRFFIRNLPPYIEPEKIHEEAAWAMQHMGPSAQTLLPLLTDTLADTNKYLGTLFLLGCVGENREQVVPLLTKALQHPDAWTRIMALQSLGRLGDAADVALPELLDLFEKSNPPDLQLIILVGNIGPAAKAAAPKLEKLCAAPNREQTVAAIALYQIDPGNEKALSVLNDLASDPKQVENNAWALGAARKPPLQFIHPLIKSTNEAAFVLSVSTLEKISPQAAIDILLKELKSNRRNNQLWAAGWILRIDRNHAQARAFLLDYFKNPNREIIWDTYAIEQLGEASPDAGEIISFLEITATKNPKEGLRRAAKQSLKRIKIRELMRKEGWKENSSY